MDSEVSSSHTVNEVQTALEGCRHQLVRGEHTLAVFEEHRLLFWLLIVIDAVGRAVAWVGFNEHFDLQSAAQPLSRLVLPCQEVPWSVGELALLHLHRGSVSRNGRPVPNLEWFACP